MPANRPLANLAIGNMCFFILQRLTCSKWHFWIELCYWNWLKKKLWKSFFGFLVKCSTLVAGGRGVRLSRQWIRLANLAIGTMCFFILQGLSCSKSSPNGFPARSNPKNVFLKRATEIDRKKSYENHFFGFWYAPLWSLVPTNRPLANLAIGNMCFLFYKD